MKTLIPAGGVLLSIFLLTSAALATYSVPISAFSESAGKVSAGQYEISFTAGQASPIGAVTSGGFSLVSGIMPTVMDVVPPVILHTPAPLTAANAAVTVEADIEDEVTGVDSVKLYYHEGGLTAFKMRWMLSTSGTTYRATIPQNSVTERGLVYYIEAFDGMGNVSTLPEGAPDSLQNLPVYFDALTADMNLTSGEYSMISLPGTPTDGSPDSVLVDDYGSYNKKSWRLGRWNAAGGCTTGCYDEYPDIADFAPGRAYWLILDSARLFDFRGISTDVSRPCRIHLDRGWNQIGTPYAFGTKWSTGWVVFDGQKYSIGAEHVVGTDTIMVENNLIGYDGDYQNFQTHLGVWIGCWVFNASTREVELAFPPEIVTAAILEASVADGAPVAEGRVEALLGITVTGRPGHDEIQRRCYAGLAEDARDGWDARDLHAPPAIGGEMRAMFRRGTWGRLSGDYMTDMRGVSADGQTWTVTVEAGSHDYVEIEVEPIVELPEGWSVALYDRARGVKTTGTGDPYLLEVKGRAGVEIFAGTDEFIAGEEVKKGVELRTQLMSLSPNPFHEDVAISFYLSSPERVSLRVYNIEGALVADLADEVLAPGVHRRTWDGRTQSGRPAASGVYFLRMVADSVDRTDKIIRLR
ncbi:MAG: FlgD immunoglobulin-like domain containing protein [bacterium]